MLNSTPRPLEESLLEDIPSGDGAEDFEWICLKNELHWSEIEKAAENINKMQKPQLKTQMIDELFDEVFLAKSFFQKSNEANYSEKWVQLFTHFYKQHIEVPNLKKIVEFVMCLPVLQRQWKEFFHR